MRPSNCGPGLKLIKAGMETRAVRQRFEQERQALALMDHPNIARVPDAGEAAPRRPYFAIELVRGVTITEYGDQNRLTPSERLELFLSVCQAVPPAYRKGISHRDPETANVLVTLHDGVSDDGDLSPAPCSWRMVAFACVRRTVTGCE